MDIQAQLIAYLDNQLAADKKRTFEDQLKSSPELQQELEDIRFIRNSCETLLMHKQVDTVKHWKEISKRITINKYKILLWTYTRNIAATLIIPLFITVISLYNKTNIGEKPFEQITISSAPGIVTKIILPDSSEVWLNAGSTLIYPKIFENNKRSVELAGEAFFRVKADKSNCFVVSTNEGLSVNAYGTEFNVCAYDNESTIAATLVSGNIEITNTLDEKPIGTKISKGQQVLFDKKSGNLVVETINITVETSWKDGKMIFRRADMNEVIRRLSRRYNVDFQLEDSELHDYAYSATFTTETLDDILYLLETSAPIKCKVIYPQQIEDYSFAKRTVIISKKR